MLSSCSIQQSHSETASGCGRQFQPKTQNLRASKNLIQEKEKEKKEGKKET